MAKVGRQQGKSPLGILTGLIPLHEDIRRKAMTQVVQTRAMTVRGAPQADLSRQRIERSMNLSAIQSMAPVGDEQIRGDHSSHPMTPTSGDIVRQHRTGRGMQRHEASFTELGT